MKLVSKIVFFFNIGLVLLTLLAYLSPFINPAEFWGLSFLGLAFPLFLLLNLFFIFYWLINNWKKSWLSIICLLIGAYYLTLTISFSNPETNEIESFSVASYNMNYAHGTYKKGTYRYDKEKTKEFADFIVNGIDADIFCGQESNQFIRTLVGKYYPHQHFIKEAGTTIYSIYPIVDRGNIDFGTITNSCVWADIVVQKDTFRVYSAHLQSNHISSEADKIVEEVGQKQEVSIINIRTILSKYKRYVGIRARQAIMIRDHMIASPHPVIFAGDINDPPVSYTHRILSKNKKDSFVEAGKGLGVTYAGNIPLLRIDNILLSDNVDVLSHQVIRKKFSDHYPVKVAITK